MIIPPLSPAIIAAIFYMADLPEEPISDGDRCRMTLRVSELRAMPIPGAPLHSGPADMHLDLVTVDDPKAPLCLRAMAARDITMNAASERLGDAMPDVGEEFATEVSYHEFMAGKMLYDEYHHVAVIEADDGTSVIYRGMGLLP
jgi:hypothetical protein